MNLGVKDYIIEQWENEEDDEVGLLGFNNDNYLSPPKKKVRRDRLQSNMHLLGKVNEENEKEAEQSVSVNGSGDSELDKYLRKQNKRK